MSFNQSMSINLNSMKNNQYALAVVSQNIANLHVEGYHRQRVNFVTNDYTTNCENVISTIKGMNGASISSLSDFIDNAAFRDKLNSNSDANYYNTLADALGELEDIADDLGDNGLNGLLNSFYAAASDLEKFPSDMTVRQQYVIAAQNVCDKFNEVSKKYNNIQEDKFQIVGNNINTINSLIESLASANEAHIKNNQGASTQVDINNILEELSNYIDIKTEKNSNGTVNLLIGDVEVLRGTDVEFKLQGKFDSTSLDNPLELSLKSTRDESYIKDGVEEAFNSGSMKGYIEFLQGGNDTFANLNDMKANLNAAASAFANALNEIQQYEYTDPVTNIKTFAASIKTDEATGDLILEQATEPMFIAKNGGAIDASNIQVNSIIAKDPFKIAAARIDMANFTDKDGNVDDTWVKAIGNSDNAVLISALQNKKICSYNGGANNCTLSDFLINNAAKNGMDIANIEQKASTAQDIADTDATNYANMVGVNLDEELADMIRYQRAFEASAKVFSTVNDLIGTLISMV